MDFASFDYSAQQSVIDFGLPVAFSCGQTVWSVYFKGHVEEYFTHCSSFVHFYRIAEAG